MFGRVDTYGSSYCLAEMPTEACFRAQLRILKLKKLKIKLVLQR